MSIQSTNPATGQVESSFEPHDATEVEARLALAAECFGTFRTTSFEQRRAWMLASADLLESEVPDIARIMTLEMGKTLKAAEAEATKCVTGMRFYATHAEGFLADQALGDPGSVGASRAYRRHQPLGVVLAVMPWNFPLWQVVRFAAPALMAGNVGLLKHASNVPQSALYLGELFRRGGFPDGCFQTLLIESRSVEAVLRDPRVAAATLTGSEGAGRAVAAVAGDEVKKTVLELGGSDPFVVLPSADIAQAAQVAIKARVQNNGQSCIAAKRFIVHTDVFDEFAQHFVDGMRALRVGDPMDADTDVGPVATEQGRADLVQLVDDAVAHGADVLCGGSTIDGPGWFFEPTIVAGVTADMALHLEEAFGPVATLYRVADVDEAIALANVTSFGLSSNVWTTDPDEQERVVNGIDAGGVFVNGMTISYPELPFGGIKRSGYGRELSDLGILEFCNTKTVWVA